MHGAGRGPTFPEPLSLSDQKTGRHGRSGVPGEPEQPGPRDAAGGAFRAAQGAHWCVVARVGGRFLTEGRSAERKKAKARLTRKSRRQTGESKSDKLSAKKRELEEKYMDQEEEEGEVAPSLARRQEMAAKRERAAQAGGEDEEDERTGGPVRPEDRATYQEAVRIRGPRPMLLKYMLEPFFEKTVVGLLVRVAIGQDAQQLMRYRVARVEKVTIKRNYQLTGLDGKLTDSNVWLELSQGRSTKSFKIREISSDPFSEQEYDKWLKNLLESQCEPLSKQDVARKLADLAVRSFVMFGSCLV
jgi:RNA polymerase-associated protein RTF1